MLAGMIRARSMTLPRDLDRELNDMLGPRDAAPELSSGLLDASEGVGHAVAARRPLVVTAACLVMCALVLVPARVLPRGSTAVALPVVTDASPTPAAAGERVSAVEETAAPRAPLGQQLAPPALQDGAAPTDPAAASPPVAAEPTVRPALLEGSQQPCLVLWRFSVADMVGYGFGASLKQLAFMRVWASRHGCGMPVGEAFAQGWAGWDLGTFWDRTVPDERWAAAWSQAQPCGYLNQKIVRCASSDPSLVEVNWDLEDLQCDQAYLESMLETFLPRLSEARRPFPGPYAGLHVRHGDKALESKIFPFQAHMDELAQRWPSVHKIFVATDDSEVISQRIAAFEARGLNVTWTKDERRWAGGSPQTAPAFQAGHHDNNEAAIQALLDDIASLATASVLVGSFASNFFRVAWFLNTGFHRHLQRRGPWCYDLFVGSPCDDLNGQVLAYCRERARKMSCDLPHMEELCGRGAAAVVTAPPGSAGVVA